MGGPWGCGPRRDRSGKRERSRGAGHRNRAWGGACARTGVTATVHDAAPGTAGWVAALGRGREPRRQIGAPAAHAHCRTWHET